MASKFPEEREETGQLRTRKGHDVAWSCDKHAEPIKFYCKDHTIPICHPCATKDHVKKQCELQDIEDVILEMRIKLEDAQTKIAASKKRLKTVDSKINSNETSETDHLQSISDEVNATYDRKLKSVTDKERDEIRLINEEADQEIRFINEKRERRIKACKEEVKKQQKISKDIQARLLSEIKKINTTVRKKIEDLKNKNQCAINTMDNMDSKIESIKQDDQTLVNEAPQVIASLDENLNSNVHQEVADYLDRIERDVQRVKFVEGEVGGENYGRIDGYIGKWELIKSIDIPSIVNEPWVRGLISDDEICVLDMSDKALYFTNTSSEHTEKVIEGNSNMYVTSCAPVDRNVIVCGKERGYCTDDRLDGCITLYDRKWNVIRDITIPRNKSSTYKIVYVDVDSNGMILAAQLFQSNLYVINPADGKIVNTIMMQDKKVWDRIQALSSGDIVVQTGWKEFTLISRSGEEKAVIHSDEWELSQCYVDKLTDTLYITIAYEGEEREVYAVDQVSRYGNIQARRIVEYKQSYHSSFFGPCPLIPVTPSGNLVACDGDKIFVYKNSFLV